MSHWLLRIDEFKKEPKYYEFDFLDELEKYVKYRRKGKCSYAVYEHTKRYTNKVNRLEEQDG